MVTPMSFRGSLLALTVFLATAVLGPGDAHAARRRSRARSVRKSFTMPLPPRDVKDAPDVPRCAPAADSDFDAFTPGATPEVAGLVERARGGGCVVAVACGGRHEAPATLFLSGCADHAPAQLTRDTHGRIVASDVAVSMNARWLRATFAFAPGAMVPEVDGLVPARALPRLASLWRSLDEAHADRSESAVFELLSTRGDADESPVWRGVRVLDGDRLLEAAFLVERDSLPGGFFGLGGNAVSDAFLAAPLDEFRVSRGVKWVPMKVRGRGGHARHGRGRGRGRGRVFSRIRLHQGIDFAAPTGTPIRTTASGLVSFVGWRGGYGNFVVVTHPGGYVTRYGHMSAFADGLEVGTPVVEGDVIGYVGSTGLSTGPHVHYELRLADTVLDPETWAPAALARLTTEEYAAWLAGHARLLDSEPETTPLEPVAPVAAQVPSDPVALRLDMATVGPAAGHPGGRRPVWSSLSAVE
jgi:murein DD-endopeptidase MepM/ murein hydrolase activator NlpD